MITLNIHDPWNLISDPQSRFTWEYDAVPFYSRNSTLFAILAILYLPVTFSLQHFMKNRTPFQLKTLLKIWNISIALFSIIGTFKLLPTLLESIINYGYLTSICYNSCYYAHDHSWVPPHAAIWVFYFNVSKLPEWIDTFFIVLRKRPLIFLHYYHHIFTFLFCWYANQYSPQFHSAGFFFATTNLAIHSFMYSYYTLCSFGYRPSWNKYLTAAQVLQMILGIFFLLSITTCPKVSFSADEPENLILVAAGLVMYLSYFILFMKFFFDRYSKPAAKSSPNPDQKTSSNSPSSPTSIKKTVKKE